MESIGDGTTVGTGMNLKLNGLAEGSYWLVETQAPDGYNKLTAPVKITITKSDTTNVNDWTIKQNDGVVDDKIIDIENTTGTLLPETGGMGYCNFHSDCSCDDSRYCGKLRDQQKENVLKSFIIQTYG